MRDGMRRTFDALTKAGKEVYFVLDDPMYKAERWAKCNASVVRRPVAISTFLSAENKKVCQMKLSDRIDRIQLANWTKLAKELSAGHKNIHFIELADAFCMNGICSMLDRNGNMLYKDGGHLNIKGSIQAASLIFRKMGQQ
jgi:hypothetical protein